MDQSKLKRKDPWDYVLPSHLERYGNDIADPDRRAILCQAIFYAGNTLRLWNEATELKIALLSACALQKGQNIVVICKYGDESGLVPALKSLIGPKGSITLEEIGAQAMAAFSQIRSTPGAKLQWNFDYFDSLKNESVDRVILFGAASHILNLSECAQQIS